jgi:hypothetical protein
MSPRHKTEKVCAGSARQEIQRVPPRAGGPQRVTGGNSSLRPPAKPAGKSLMIIKRFFNAIIGKKCPSGSMDRARHS